MDELDYTREQVAQADGRDRHSIRMVSGFSAAPEYPWRAEAAN